MPAHASGAAPRNILRNAPLPVERSMQPRRYEDRLPGVTMCSQHEQTSGNVITPYFFGRADTFGLEKPSVPASQIRRQRSGTGRVATTHFFLAARCTNRFGISRHRGLDQFAEGAFTDRLPFAKYNRKPRVSFQAGIEKLRLVFEASSAKETELHDLPVRFSCANNRVMRLSTVTSERSRRC